MNNELMMPGTLLPKSGSSGAICDFPDHAMHKVQPRTLFTSVSRRQETLHQQGGHR
ncbi:MAG: hypothetical protein KJP16_08910 [Gammaproteobacteria bacterium]|nr:hypothetical protein [Gammaproteobacteria bacterium]